MLVLSSQRASFSMQSKALSPKLHSVLSDGTRHTKTPDAAKPLASSPTTSPSARKSSRDTGALSSALLLRHDIVNVLPPVATAPWVGERSVMLGSALTNCSEAVATHW